MNTAPCGPRASSSAAIVRWSNRTHHGILHANNSARRSNKMAFSLIDDDAGAVPVVAVSKAGLAAWHENAPARERDWVMATGFTGEAGKLALVPDKKGGLRRALIGLAGGQAGAMG